MYRHPGKVLSILIAGSISLAIYAFTHDARYSWKTKNGFHYESHTITDTPAIAKEDSIISVKSID